MKHDTVLRQEGMRVLSEKLGILDAERFITLILREPFDYTEWQKNLYETLSVEELGKKAKDLWEKAH